MKASAFFILFAIAIATTWFGCATLQEFVKKPEISLQNVTFQDASLFQVTPVFKFKVDNPNPVSIPLGDIAYRVQIDGKQFAKGQTNAGAYLDASGSAMVEIPLTVKYMDAVNSFTDFIQTRKLAYKLTGTLPAGPFQIPLSAEGTLKLPEIPDIRIKAVSVDRLTLTGASMVFDIEMKNANPFPVNLSGLDYQIRLGNNHVASGKGSRRQILKQNNTTMMEIPVDLDFMKMGRSIADILSRKNVSYQFSGDMKFSLPSMGEKRMPFNKSGEIPLIR